MLHRKTPLSDAGLLCLLKTLSATQEFDKTLSLVQNLKVRNCMVDGSVAAALIVDGLCRAGRIEDAWTALTELRLVEWKPDFIAYRIVSQGFRLAGRFEEERRILKQKRKFGVAPRERDYGEFILSLVSEGRIRDAKELGEAIVYGDFPMSSHVLESLIVSVSDVDADSTIQLLNYMVEKERVPGLAMIKYVCRNLGKNKKGDAMWDVLRILLDKGYFTSVEGYRLVVYFLCKVGKLREAYDVLKEMKKKSLGRMLTLTIV